MHNFVKDESGYTKWIKEHPADKMGYVVNSPRSLNQKNTYLHRSTCMTISPDKKGYKNGGYTERQYIKFCAETVEEVVREIQRATASKDETFPPKCRICAP